MGAVRVSKLTKQQRALIERALKAATFENALFYNIVKQGPFPKCEAEVTMWIQERTRLYRESWIIARLQAILDGTENEWGL